VSSASCECERNSRGSLSSFLDQPFSSAWSMSVPGSPATSVASLGPHGTSSTKPVLRASILRQGHLISETSDEETDYEPPNTILEEPIYSAFHLCRHFSRGTGRKRTRTRRFALFTHAAYFQMHRHLAGLTTHFMF
jgi:hypothetical protein